MHTKQASSKYAHDHGVICPKNSDITILL